MPDEGTAQIPEEVLRCRVCGRTFESREALREHVESIGLVR